MSIRERILTLMIGDGCPLLGVNPTSLLHRGSDANDPKETSVPIAHSNITRVP